MLLLEAHIKSLLGKDILPVNIIDEINNIRGSAFIGVVCKTIPKMRKTNNPYYDKIVKVSHFTAQVNFDYENAVNNQREREGKKTDFESMPSYASVITRDDGTLTPFAKHKTSGAVYLRVRPIQYSDSSYFYNGKQISKDTLASFLIESNSSERQELNKPIPYRLIDIKNVVAVRYNNRNMIPVQE